MAKGIRLPVATNPRGGAEISEGSELLRQLIMLGVKPASNLHPWNQELTPRADIIFDINDGVLGSEFEGAIYDLFDDLERLGLAAISKGRGGIFVETQNRDKGELEVIVRYTDLEEMKSREIRFPTGGK
jgi:hypothetical protein